MGGLAQSLSICDEEHGESSRRLTPGSSVSSQSNELAMSKEGDTDQTGSMLVSSGLAKVYNSITVTVSVTVVRVQHASQYAAKF